MFDVLVINVKSKLLNKHHDMISLYNRGVFIFQINFFGRIFKTKVLPYMFDRVSYLPLIYSVSAVEKKIAKSLDKSDSLF